LLINCLHLNELYIIDYISNNWGDDNDDNIFNWGRLFEVLTRFSPTSLFKFKFYFYETPELKSLKLFFDNWKGRHPMLFGTVKYIWGNWGWDDKYLDLME